MLPLIALAAAAGAVATATDVVAPPANCSVHRPMDFRTVRALAFEICLKDAVCAQRFYIAHTTFDIGLFRHFFDRFVADTGAHDYLVANYAADAVKRGWLYTMRQASFCTDNELPSEDGLRCVCRNGRVCHEESPSAYNIDTLSFTVLLVAMLVATFGFSMAHLEQLRAIDSDVRALRREERARQQEQHRQQPRQTAAPPDHPVGAAATDTPTRGTGEVRFVA